MRSFMILILFLFGCVITQAQTTWKPAIVFAHKLGFATYIPGHGECGYVQFAFGPDGTPWGIYDLKTLSDTSTVRCTIEGEISEKRAGGIFDVNANNLPDLVTARAVHFDVCTPNQFMFVRETAQPIVSFGAGQADIDGNGIPEFLASPDQSTLATWSSVTQSFHKQVVISTHTYPDGQPPQILHLGTLSGQPRFITLSGLSNGIESTASLVLEKLDASQVTSETDTITLHTISRNNADVVNYAPGRLFIFPDVWFLPRRDAKMWVITADTIVTAPYDPTMGIDIDNHLGQSRGYREVSSFFTIDGTKPEITGYDYGFENLRYTQLHAEGTRLWAGGTGFIRIDTLRDGSHMAAPLECAVVGDVDADGFPDVLLSVGNNLDISTETRLYLTTGRTLTDIQETKQPILIVQRTALGWILPMAACASAASRAAVYDVQGSLITMTDAMPHTDGILIREVQLPPGLMFAVVGSCVVRLQ